MVLGGFLDPYDMEKVKWRIHCRRTLYVCKSINSSNVLWSVQCSFHTSGVTQALTRATRDEIERVLKFLLTQIEPRDDKLHNYERTINETMLKRLRFRKDVFGRKWFKDHIRKAFDAWPEKTQAISQFRNNSHFPDVQKYKCNLVQNLVVRVKRGPEATLDYIYGFRWRLF